mmetsp:Transcript_13376/g.20813  ORF Transcript_13376/g.20813 Transcript_13376/m.20813 type:complete len:818 (-) Transcript_13376:36-2489(-)
MDVHPKSPPNEMKDESSSSVDESSSTKSDTDNAPPAPKQTRSSVWGIIPAAAVQVDSNKQRSSATLADIMVEQESEKIKQENIINAKVKFSNDVESEEERMMRLAIEASLRDQQHDEVEATKQPESVLKNSHASLSNNTSTYDDNDDMDEEIKMAIALSLASASVSNDRYNLHEDNDNTSDEWKPSSVGNDTTEVTRDDDGDDDDNRKPSAMNNEATDHDDRKPSATDISNDPHDEDESEKLARALHEAEIEEYKSSQAAQDAAAEAASLALALQLQREEDSRHLNNVTIENANRAAQLKREAMCRGDSVASTGIRTVDRDEFQRMQGAKSTKGYGGDRIADRRRDEERGMGKLLNTHYPEDASGDTGGVYPSNDADSYYYYANDRLQEDEDDDGHVEEEYFGIKMNAQSTSSSWQRVDKDTFIGPNNELKSKHDPELKHKSNAMNLLDGNGGKSTAVSDRAYNAFRRSEARQSGMKKGVLTQGHGRAENMNAAKTRGGAMDGNVRLQIAAAVNMGLIERCNGVVKEGKEGLVYHAESGRKGSTSSMPEMDSDGHDVAVKVFKRISEFRNRREYIDGDPRYVKQKFKTNDAREQVVLWTEKEYRNLLRAWRGGISVPKPIYQTNNILFMRFLGDDGWPSPQLRELEIKKGSGRWTTLYCQTLVAIRRLYHCARLVHGDLSEYNILVCPKWQVKKGLLLLPDERTSGDEDLQVVLIDFGQAVDIGHPNADEFLQRDISTVTQFFANQGITTLTATNAKQFVVETSCSDAEELIDDNDDDYEEEVEEEGSKKTSNWRNIAATWDENSDLEALLARLKLK